MQDSHLSSPELYIVLIRLSSVADARALSIFENVYRFARKYYYIRFTYARHIRRTCVISENARFQNVHRVSFSQQS